MEYKRPKYLKIFAIIILAMLIVFVFTGILVSKRLKISSYSFTKNGLSGDFTIMHISDLHYPYNDVALDKVVGEVDKAKPDIIALTGDIIDGAATQEDMRYIFDFFNEFAQKSTVFYILGNHEIGHESLKYYVNLLTYSNIIYLNNELKTITVNGDKIAIIGVSDGKKLNIDNVPTLEAKSSCSYSILLAHRPELFDNYCENSVDLVLSGHTHGGQIRLFGQGFFAPNQGYFPRYSHGLYQNGITHMLVNSALKGKGRFYNPYEINKIRISP